MRLAAKFWYNLRMGTIPATSITLLKAISSSAESMRWTEFFNRYEPHMRGFMRAKFPSVEPDDAIQETMVALIKALPGYHYIPDEKGHFRNYLMGVLSHKAADILRKNIKQSGIKSMLKNEHDADAPKEDDIGAAEYETWKASAMEAAIEMLMSDASILPATREVFRHVALVHENPEDVARMFGISRNNVDQIKKRMIMKLTKIVNAMTRK